MTHALSIETLGVNYGNTPVLANVTFNVDTGDWLSVVGPNGAGKSTLLKAIAGLVRRNGTVRLNGENAAGMSARAVARRVAYLPQSAVVPNGYSVRTYVSLGRASHVSFLSGVTKQDQQAVEQSLVDLELAQLAERDMTQLSGGEKQRAVLARALAQEAPLLLLDEPTSALDIGHQQKLLTLIDELRATRQLTVVSTIHDLTLAGRRAGSMLMLNQGRVVAHGQAVDVLTKDNIERVYQARVTVDTYDNGLLVVPSN